MLDLYFTPAIKSSFCRALRLRRSLAKMQNDNKDWVLGLGMHNFRALERVGMSKFQSSLCNEKSDSCVGSVTEKKMRVSKRRISRGCKRNRRDRNRHSLEHARWSSKSCSSSQDYSGEKARKAAMVEHEFKRICRTISCFYGISSRQSGQYTHVFPATQTLSLSSERKHGRFTEKFQARCDKRMKFVKTHSYDKLPGSYLKHAGRDGFVKYWKYIALVGSKKAFFLTSNWKSKEGMRIKKIFDDINKDRHTISGVLNEQKNVGPKPDRGNFKNYKDWGTAVGRWQLIRRVCGDCIRTYQARADFDCGIGFYKSGVENFVKPSYPTERRDPKLYVEGCFKCGSDIWASSKK